MPHMAAEFCPDYPGIGIVAVRGDPIPGYAGHRLCLSKEGLRSSKVAVLTQHHVNQGASAIDRAIQIPPTTTHPNVCLVDVPVPTANPKQLTVTHDRLIIVAMGDLFK